jgi:hypothetical protein
MLELLELILNFDSLAVTSFLKICDVKFLKFFFGCLYIFLNLDYFFHFFSLNNCQVMKVLKPKKYVGCGVGVIQLFK